MRPLLSSVQDSRRKYAPLGIDEASGGSWWVELYLAYAGGRASARANVLKKLIHHDPPPGWEPKQIRRRTST